MSEDLTYYLLMNTIGLSVIHQTIKDAYLYLTHSGKITKQTLEYKDAFMFLKSTGFDMLMVEYNIDYNPDAIRAGLYNLVKRKDLIE